MIIGNDSGISLKIFSAFAFTSLTLVSIISQGWEAGPDLIRFDRFCQTGSRTLSGPAQVGFFFCNRGKCQKLNRCITKSVNEVTRTLVHMDHFCFLLN